MLIADHLLVRSLLLTSMFCFAEAATVQTAAPNFEHGIAPILQQSCAQCHIGASTRLTISFCRD